MGFGGMRAKGPLDENEKRRLVLKLITRLRCAECDRPFHPHDFVPIEKHPDVWVLGIECRHCGQAIQVLVFMRLDADGQLVSDLTPAEKKVAGEWPPIDADDVLDVHTFLRVFDGDFAALFAD